jgi:hypothetical protein
MDAAASITWREANGMLAGEGRTLCVEGPRRIEACVDPSASEGPRAARLGTVWPLVRRLASESRDRLGPLARRGSGAARTDAAA